MPITLKLPGGQTVTVPDDTTPEEMDAIANERAAPPVKTKADGSATIGDHLKAKGADLAPSVGGLAGGLVGGIPGAAVGGAAGQGIGNLIEHGAEIPGAIRDVARNMFSEPVATMRGFAEGTTEGAIDTAKAAGLEGAAQAAGGVVAGAAGKLSKWLMNRATTRVTERLMREFPDLPDTLIDNALTVSKGGYDKALGLLKTAKKKATTALAVADASGATVPIQVSADVADSLKTALLEEAIKSRGIPVSVGAVQSATNRLPAHLRTLFTQIDAQVQGGGLLHLTPSHADLLKRRMQQESRALYANRAATNGPKAMGMDAAERADYAAELNTKIDGVASGYKAANAEAKPLIGAVRGIKQATRPNGNLYQAMVRPAVGAMLGEGAGQTQGLPTGTGAMAGALLTSPGGMSREAIILKDPRVQQMLRQLPRASAAMLTQLLGELGRNPEAAPAPQGGSQK